MPDAPQKAQKRLKPRTYAAIPAQAMNDDRLQPSRWQVLAAISWHAKTDGYAWPDQDLLAFETGLNRSTVNRAVGDLERLGYLVKVKRKRRHGHWPANTYRVVRVKPHFPDEPP